MWLDVVAGVVLLLFIFVGALRGGWAAGLSLATLGVGYAAAIWAAPRYGALVSELTGVSEWLGMPLAGSCGFLLAFVAMSCVAKLVKRFDVRIAGEGRSPRDRFLGGVFGGARGALARCRSCPSWALLTPRASPSTRSRRA